MRLGVIARPFSRLRFGFGMFRGIGQDPFNDMDQAIETRATGCRLARQIIGRLYKDRIDDAFLRDFESGALVLKKAA